MWPDRQCQVCQLVDAGQLEWNSGLAFVRPKMQYWSDQVGLSHSPVSTDLCVVGVAICCLAVSLYEPLLVPRST